MSVWTCLALSTYRPPFSNEIRANNLNVIQLQSQKSYGDTVSRLLFNLIRSMTPEWPVSVRYPPMDPLQITALQELRNVLDQDSEEAVDAAFHQVCYLLYAHERHQYPISEGLCKFFSPVIVFLVYSCMGKDGSFQLASEMTGKCAALEYSIRCTMLAEIDRISQAQHVRTFEYVFLFFSVRLVLMPSY